MTITTVEEFKDAWLGAGCPIRPPFENPIFTTDMSYSLVLFRAAEYQVELVICKPNSQPPFHQHPGVDSFFIYLAGNIDGGKSNGTFTDLSMFQKPRPDGAHMLLGQTTTALNGELHSRRTGPEGGAFLSFEKWNEQKPNGVVINWSGDSMGPDHDALIGASG